MTDSVLPPLPPSGLRDLDDLLTDEERDELRRDLAHMAHLRRAADSSSGSIPMF